jgi:hypothetical protein
MPIHKVRRVKARKDNHFSIFVKNVILEHDVTSFLLVSDDIIPQKRAVVKRFEKINVNKV